MPFGDISLPPGAFQQPNIAGSFLEGALGMQGLQTSQARADALEALARREQQATEAQTRWDEAVRTNMSGPDQEQGLAALYKINPERAMGLAKQQYEVNKLRGEVGKVNAETQGKQAESQQKIEDIAAQEAAGAAYYLKAVGNTNPQTLQGYLTGRANLWRDRNPEVYRSLMTAAQDPNVLPHIMSLAPRGGYKDPDEEMHRNVTQAVEIERGKNALPPNQYQQAQLGIDQQRLAQTGQQNQIQANQAQWGVADGLRKEFNALPEVGEYNAILPLSQAVRQASTQDNQAADLDMIYGVARMLDPKGVVRESDSSMIVATGSPAQQYLGLFNKIAGGGKLTPEIRKNLLQIADRREGAARSAYEARRNAFGGILQQRGVDPSMVFSEPMAVQGGGQAPAQPAAQSQGGGAFREGQTATNRATGQRMIFRGGQWGPL